MNNKDLVKISIYLIVILLLFFSLFILIINLVKIFDYMIKVENVLSSLKTSDKPVKTIKSEFNNYMVRDEIKFNNIDKPLSSGELGYKNSLYDINGSEWGQGINILLVGSDKTYYKHENSRSDVIIILRIIKNGKILSISIPRDTLININDGEWKGSPDKIGHSFYWGGIQNLKDSVETLIGSPIYKVAVIDNFKSFEAFLAIVGGIEIDKNLEGQTGVQWIRNRNFKYGDIERCRRQQVFLKKAVEKIWFISKEGNYFYAKFLYNTFRSILQTDITEKEFMNIIYILKKNNFNPENDFLTSVLPGEFSKYDSNLLKRNSLDCWILNNEMIDKIRFLFYSDNNTFKNSFSDKISAADFLSLDVNRVFRKKT